MKTAFIVPLALQTIFIVRKVFHPIHSVVRQYVVLDALYTLIPSTLSGSRSLLSQGVNSLSTGR